MTRKDPKQQDETRYCEHCGISYIWTLEEQRLTSWPTMDSAIIEEAIEGSGAEEGLDEGYEDSSVQEDTHGGGQHVNEHGSLTSSSLITLSATPPRYCPGCRCLLPAEGRERGVVKWYNRRKGYGFLTRSDASDIYVSRNALRRGHLRYDEFVEFTVSGNQQGPIATKVTVL